MNQDTTSRCHNPNTDPNPPALVPSNVDHGPACGERIPCPIHGQPLGPHYLPAERQVRRFGVVVILAHDCSGRWRELAS